MPIESKDVPEQPNKNKQINDEEDEDEIMTTTATSTTCSTTDEEVEQVEDVEIEGEERKQISLNKSIARRVFTKPICFALQSALLPADHYAAITFHYSNISLNTQTDTNANMASACSSRKKLKNSIKLYLHLCSDCKRTYECTSSSASITAVKDKTACSLSTFHAACEVQLPTKEIIDILRKLNRKVRFTQKLLQFKVEHVQSQLNQQYQVERKRLRRGLVPSTSTNTTTTAPTNYNNKGNDNVNNNKKN